MYARDTELRHLRQNDVYRLGVILEDNNCWRTLMEVIPRELNAAATSGAGALDWEAAVASAGLKYNADHVRLIETAIRRPGESRLHSQILFEEWGTSGRRHERPTLGVLLQLLVHAELFRAADFVAIDFLNEPPPARPLNGPAARIDISLSDDIFEDLQDIVNDSAFYPGTETLNADLCYALSAADNNKDFYTRYQRHEKNIFDDGVVGALGGPPKPPPRTMRSQRLRQRQGEEEDEAGDASSTAAATEKILNNAQRPEGSAAQLPKLSALLWTEAGPEVNAMDDLSRSTNGCSTPHTLSTELSAAPLPLLSCLAADTTAPTPENGEATSESEVPMHKESTLLPHLSALNLNGEQDVAEMQSPTTNSPTTPPRDDADSSSGGGGSCSSSSGGSSSLSRDNSLEEDMAGEGNSEDEDNSVPNLSIFEQRSSNNDSSLTTVTGTSGDNSFELSTNDNSAAASTENIPCLSALKQ